MAMLTKIGYGQVEPNHLSAQRTGQIYAQTPVNEAITELENGVFLKLNTSNNTLGVDGSGEWMLVYNEVKLYDNQRQGYKDFVLRADETVGGKIYPRMFKTNVGDIFTTNMIEAGLELGDKVTPVANEGVGILAPVGEADAEIVFEVIKLTTMPDGQDGVKVVRTK